MKWVLFGGIAPVAVTAHKSLNSSKGIIRNWELARTEPDEIKENVPMVTDVHRIVVKRNKVEIKTNTLILTFNTPQIPDYLKNCYLNISVTQRLGHVTGRCKHSETCSRCSETGHKDDTCTTHAPRNINVLTVERNMHHTTKSAVIIRGNLIFNISEYQKKYLVSKLVQ